MNQKNTDKPVRRTKQAKKEQLTIAADLAAEGIAQKLNEAPPHKNTIRHTLSKEGRPDPPRKYWRVDYAIAIGGNRIVISSGIVSAHNMRKAEDLALIRHAEEGFSRSWPIEFMDCDYGHWTNFRGFRAFETSEQSPDAEAGTLRWIDYVMEIDPDEVRIYATLPGAHLLFDKETQGNPEQLRLRGVGSDWPHGEEVKKETRRINTALSAHRISRHVEDVKTAAGLRGHKGKGVKNND